MPRSTYVVRTTTSIEIKVVHGNGVLLPPLELFFGTVLCGGIRAKHIIKWNCRIAVEVLRCRLRDFAHGQLHLKAVRANGELLVALVRVGPASDLPARPADAPAWHGDAPARRAHCTQPRWQRTCMHVATFSRVVTRVHAYNSRRHTGQVRDSEPC